MAEDIQEQVVEEPMEAQVSEPVGDPVDTAPAEDVTQEGADWSGVFDEGPAGYVDDRFASRVGELGFEVQDTQQAQNVLLDSYQQAYDHNQQWQQYHEQQQGQQQEMQQLAQQGHYFQALSQDPSFQQWAQNYGQEPQAGPEPQVEEEKHWWSPPEVSEDDIRTWREPSQNPQNGQWNWNWKPGTPSEVIQAAEKYVGYHTDWADNLARNPQEVLPQIIEQEFDKLFVDRYGQLLDEFQDRQNAETQQTNIEDINQRNADWVYQRDPAGNFARDARGQLALTPEGQEVVGYVTNLRQQGMTDPEQIWNVATQMMAGRIATGMLQQQQQAQQYQAANQQRNIDHLQRGAGYIPNREGSVAPAEVPSYTSQNPHQSVGEKLRQQALSDGLF